MSENVNNFCQEDNEIRLTENAVLAIKKEMADDESIKGIRFAIITGGCQGLTYSIEYVNEVDPADIAFCQDGVNIFVEPRAVLFLEGMVVDFKKTAMGSTFVFDNPNAVNKCGCGMSFSASKEGGCGSCRGCGCE